jgi:hypothetical protein
LQDIVIVALLTLVTVQPPPSQVNAQSALLPHEKAQPPPAHVLLHAPEPFGHAQPPTHVPPVGAATHAEAAQIWLAGHTVPHALHAAAAVVVAVSQPLAVRPSQSPKPVSHDVTAHVPVSQLDTPCGFVHGLPHPPQLVAVLVGVSQPLVMLVSQLAKPGLHDVSSHASPLHFVMPWST